MQNGSESKAIQAQTVLENHDNDKFMTHYKSYKSHMCHYLFIHIIVVYIMPFYAIYSRIELILTIIDASID